MIAFKLIFVGRNPISDDTIDGIKKYIYAVYDEAKDKKLNIKIDTVEDKHTITITLNPPQLK